MNKLARQKSLKLIEQRILDRSSASRRAYLASIKKRQSAPKLTGLSCGNLAHGFAACDKAMRANLLSGERKNFAIVSAYNEILSAHQPYVDYPKDIQTILNQQGATAQFAAGVPAMCDGVTQGQPGMQMSLFSRDLIAQSTAVALSHELFDGVFCLGICDKIVPGLLIGVLNFGHLPAVFIPAGPMPTGLSNEEKNRVRKAYAAGKASKEDLLAVEVKSYHSPGTCTFYGTANTNQLLLEAMGLHLPGASFEPPHSEKRKALNEAAVNQMMQLVAQKKPIGELVCEQSIINAMIALAASGGSTNHTIHLVAIARAAGIMIDWQDFSDLSRITPLLARVYPNGSADINQFHQAGGVPFLMSHLADLGLLLDTPTILGAGLADHFQVPNLDEHGQLTWSKVSSKSTDETVLANPGDCFDDEGGIRLLTGNLGRAIVKSSAIDKKHWQIQGAAHTFSFVEDLKVALTSDQIQTDAVILLKYQGPRACGMPELHGLMPLLSNLLDRGLKIALITDGRMSGASGRVPVALHLTPEALDNPLFCLVRDGDQVRFDIESGSLELIGDVQEIMSNRVQNHPDLSEFEQGHGRALFKSFRDQVTSAEKGACIW